VKRFAAAVAVLLGASAACAGCHRDAPAPAPPDASNAATAPSAAPPRPATPEAGAPRPHPLRPCRVMAMQGAPTIVLDASAPAPLHTSDVAQGWLSLAPGDGVTVTLPRTGRELAFVGPGVVEPCVGTDEAWLARGTFQGSRGSGEAPGADQWIVTPFGVVRYGAAILEVRVDGGTLRTSLKGGSAMILPETAGAWEQLTIGASRVVKGVPLGAAASAAAEGRCAKATAAAKTLDDAILAPGAPTSPGFGDLAARANDAHVLARATCALAGLRAQVSALAGAEATQGASR
jgi:hypothetical protein